MKQTNEQQQQQQNKTAKDKSSRLKLFVCQIKACQVVFTGTPEQDFTNKSFSFIQPILKYNSWFLRLTNRRPLFYFLKMLINHTSPKCPQLRCLW